jgi:hypothetical protein
MNTPNINIRSPEWQELRGWLVDRMEELKERVMSSSLTPEDTAKLRGKYEFATEVLGLEKRIDRQVNQRNQQA